MFHFIRDQAHLNVLYHPSRGNSTSNQPKIHSFYFSISFINYAEHFPDFLELSLARAPQTPKTWSVSAKTSEKHSSPPQKSVRSVLRHARWVWKYDSDWSRQELMENFPRKNFDFPKSHRNLHQNRPFGFLGSRFMHERVRRLRTKQKSPRVGPY